MQFADHFSTMAVRYAAYRPRYPAALVDALVARCTGWDVAWDAGCGNGQLSVALAGRFARVIATDPSQAQLEAAEPNARIEYRRATAEDSRLAGASVDLAVAAQAAHWFDWPRYCHEVERVAKPGALTALVSYGILHVDGEAGEIVASYYADVSPHWPAERRHVENGYRELVWPWAEVDAPAIDMIERWTRDELAGYVATWSATTRLVAAGQGARYDALCAELARVWPDGEARNVRWPLTIRLARR
jgi:SAM-dependent methyltransferase